MTGQRSWAKNAFDPVTTMVPREHVTRKDLDRFLPTSVQKSYFMLSDADRAVLNTALEKYRPAQSEETIAAWTIEVVHLGQAALQMYFPAQPATGSGTNTRPVG